MLTNRRAMRQVARAFRPFPIDVAARAPLLPHAPTFGAALHPLVDATLGVRLSSTANPTPNGPAAAVSVSAAPKRRASPKPAAAAAAQAPGSPKPSVPTEYIFGVQRKGKGATGFVPLAARDDMLIGFFAEEIIKKLKLDVPLDSVTLRLVGAGGKDSSVELNSMDTVHDALENAKKSLSVDLAKLRVVVDVAAPSAPAAAPAAVAVESEHKAEPHDKTFTVNGAITPAEAGLRFFLPPAVAPLINHIDKGTFFMLHGARGAGKTTTAMHALRQVRKVHGWLPLTVNMNAVAAGSSATFWTDLSTDFKVAASRMGISLPSFNSPSTFRAAFSRAVLGDSVRFVLMFDEFDDLDSATVGPRVKDEFLGAMRDIKQNIGEYAIQTAFAVGPFSILFMNAASGSPFNVREAVPVHMLEEKEVGELLTEFATAKGVALEDGIIADVYRLTAGHAGLVCACGRALDTAVPRTHDDTITLASWTDYAVRTLPLVVRDWPTIGKMARSVAGFSPQQDHMLEILLAAGDSTVTAESTSEIGSAQFLAAEGWLRSTGVAASAHLYRIASPLVRGIALAELARKATIAAPLPLDADKQLAFPDVITASLQFFKPAVMRSANSVSSKVSAAAAGSGMSVPSEAAYHAQLAFVLGAWLRGHADVFNEADSFVLAADSSARVKRKKLYADVLLVGKAAGAPKHLLELVASASDGEINEHYGRTVAYIAAHGGARGACVTFTAVDSAAAVSTVKPDALVWPTHAQLDAGLVAIYVVHDLSWTTAAVHCMKAGQAAASSQLVVLTAA